jgi:hypothetical protein
MVGARGVATSALVWHGKFYWRARGSSATSAMEASSLAAATATTYPAIQRTAGFEGRQRTAEALMLHLFFFCFLLFFFLLSFSLSDMDGKAQQQICTLI